MRGLRTSLALLLLVGSCSGAPANKAVAVRAQHHSCTHPCANAVHAKPQLRPVVPSGYMLPDGLNAFSVITR